MLSCELCEISKNTFFTKHLQLNASANSSISYAEAYSGLPQTSKIEFLAKIGYGWKPLTIFAKKSILDSWQGSGYTSDMDLVKCIQAWQMANVLTIFIEEEIKLKTTDQLTSIVYIEGILHYKINSGLSIIGLKMDSICYYAAVEKGCIGNKWVSERILMIQTFQGNRSQAIKVQKQSSRGVL